MNDILIERIVGIAVVNNLVKVECSQVDVHGKERPSGTLLIPGNQAGAVLQALIGGMQELQKQITERTAQGGQTGQGTPN